MRVPIIMPQLGESIAEATVLRIGVSTGDAVTADQEIIEVETNKALLQVTTPCAGEVLELLVTSQETYAVGSVLGYIEAAPAEAERLGLKPEASEGGAGAELRDVAEETAASSASSASSNGHLHPEETPRSSSMPTGSDSDFPLQPATGQAGLPIPAGLAGAGYASPRLRARLAELGLQAADLAGLAGTGAGGRVTVADLEKYLSHVQTLPSEPASAMRLAVGETLRRSVARPLATVGRPVCLDALIAQRSAQTDPKPAFVLYVMRALALALAKDRGPVARVIGKRLLTAASIDIGCAVEVDGGLMVPVLRAVDATPVRELAGRFQELVAAARRRQLPPEATGGAVATISNFGTFGLTWATPIPLPDESIMLGLGASRKVPHWDAAKEAFVPITEAELTLTLDHRVLDGGGAGRLLERVTQLLQEPEKL